MKSGGGKTLILAAMIFAVSMTFIDMTIVAIAVPQLQQDLSLSSTGVQWIVNGYLLSLSALFAFGGRLADIAGHRSMVVIGVIVFATASALCGATPTGSAAEPWIIFFRVIQGAGAALMFPAALAIVLGAFPVHERGRALAIFFGIAGGFTSLGPILGGYLTEWTWRAIFWVNIPVAILALVTTAISKPANEKHPAPLDYRGALLISAGMGLAVLGFQQSSVWGWGSPVTWICIAAGIALIAAFARYELRIETPLMQVRSFANRAFAVDNAILFLLMIPFVPLFFFASMYAQISLGESASETGLYLLIFFAGFFVATQWGGKILDTRGARPAVVLGCFVAAVGFALWAKAMPELSVGSQWPFNGAGRGRRRPRPQPGQHRRPQPGAAQPLRRGDRDHPDGAQLRLQPRPRGARHAPDPAEQVEPGDDAGRRGRAEGQGRPDRRRAERIGRRQRSRLRRSGRRPGGEDLLRGPARLRPRHPQRLLRDGRGDGGRLPRRPDLDAGRQGRGPRRLTHRGRISLRYADENTTASVRWALVR
jgi:MFS family permease